MSFSGHERHEGGYMLLRPMVGVMMVTAMVRNFTRLSHVRILGMDSYGFHSNRRLDICSLLSNASWRLNCFFLLNV